jgi:hypothetical protein
MNRKNKAKNGSVGKFVLLEIAVVVATILIWRSAYKLMDLTPLFQTATASTILLITGASILVGVIIYSSKIKNNATNKAVEMGMYNGSKRDNNVINMRKTRLIAVIIVALSLAGTGIVLGLVNSNNPGNNAPRYNNHPALDVSNSVLIENNKLPVFNETLLDLNSIPVYVKITFTDPEGQVSGMMIESLALKFSEGELSTKLAMPLYTGNESNIFYGYNGNWSPQTGYQYIFKYSDNTWYMTRWPQYVGEISNYLNSISEIAA